MSFYLQLREKLKRLDSKELDLLPRSYQVLGKIMLIKLDKKLIKRRKLIGKTILKMLPYLHTICLEKSITGVKRKPKIEVIAGCKSTQTIHHEHGHRFFIDVADVMWSKGNKEERLRMLNVAKSNEVVVDMFCGVGYWCIFLARKAKKVYAIDINPKAVEYLRKNVFMNKVEGRIEILQGDCRDYVNALENTADRIVMGHLYETEKFLPYALKIAKKGCIIHFHRIVRDGEKLKLKGIKVLGIRKVKSYAPKVWHVVYDLKKI